MTDTIRRQLLATTVLAVGCAVAAPAAAQTAPQPTTTTAESGKGKGGDIRPFAPTISEPVVESGRAKGGETKDIRPFAMGDIRPFSLDRSGKGKDIRAFAGNILPNAGNIRTFAGELSGSAGNIRTFAGNIRTFEGQGSAMAGNIRTFAGNIRTFAGNIRTFQGEVNPLSGPDANFWGTLKPQAGSLSAMAGNIRTFAGEFEAYAGNIRTFAGNIRTFAGNIRTFAEAPDAYTGMHAEVVKLVDQSRLAYGPAVTLRTGKSFDEGFANRLLGKYGISLTDPKSMVGLNELGVEMFLLDWYDNVNNYSGQDQVDHWMKAVNWSPALTQNMGNGVDTKIGILDFSITGDEAGNIVGSGGFVSSPESLHGSAVASLIVAKHDGRGVMGFAPNASVVNYNPFDSTNTAGWADIKTGVRKLLEYKDAAGKRVSVVNMSLGVPGVTLHSGWNDQVFNEKWMHDNAKSRVFVLAAGNEGIEHPKETEVNWRFDKNPNIIIVGSVDPSNQISQFSNTPGEGKFKKLSGNDPLGTDMLRDRFIVAPGEWMLVSDGQGGVTRMSGTSFAAPLVSGTIALVHDRWPWLADNPVDTVNLILNSATDLGTPGVDNVYGRGMLNVARALEPGNFFALQWKQVKNGVTTNSTASSVLATNQNTIATWEANSVYFSVFEDTGALSDSYRDFAIPMSSKLIGQTVGTTGEQFNGYLQSRFWSWYNANCATCRTTSGGDDDDSDDFANRYMTSTVGSVAGMRLAATAVPRTFRPGLRQSDMPFDTAMALRSGDGRFAAKFGSGSGAEFTGQQGFGLQSDYDVLTGGANPFLGLASGSGYAAIEMRIGERVTVSSGVSRQAQILDETRMSTQERQILGSIDPYRATANTMTVTYRANDKLTTSLGYTMLNEDTGLLGVRSLDPNDLNGGTTTDAATFGADYAATKSLSFSLTGTMGRTRAGGDRGIAVSEGGLVSSAWQVAVAKQGLFDGQDRLRFTVAQPLHIESGRVDFSHVGVVDRQTGELGEITQSVAIDGGKRRYVAEALYGRTIGDGAAQVNLFGRADLGADEARQARLTLGGNFRLAF